VHPEILSATHTGELRLGDLSISCAVLEDGTRILSERGVTKALGAKRGGAHWRRKRAGDDGADLPVYLSANNLKPFIGSELSAALTEPVLYIPPQGGPPGHGVRAELLPSICDVLLRARENGQLHPSQAHIAQQAEILVRAFAHVGIISLVDEATGYQDVRARRALEDILDKFISEELRKWAKTFPDDFYREMFRLKGWPYKPWSHSRPSVVGKYTNNLVYERLVPGVLMELQKKNPTVSPGQRQHKHFQFLTEDIGHPALRSHLAGVIALMKASANWREFKRLLNRSYAKFGENYELLLAETVEAGG
jgi:hypothetical protein